MKDWVIYYDDGTKFSNLDGTPDQSPVKAVVCIPHRKNAWTAHQLDWYYWDIANDEWWGGDIHGLLHQLKKNAANITAVRKGAFCSDLYPDVMWQAFLERTEND